MGSRSWSFPGNAQADCRRRYSIYRIIFRQVDPTVFQFPEIQEIVYRINGDAEQFGHMFEITCEPVTRRPAPTSQPGEESS